MHISRRQFSAFLPAASLTLWGGPRVLGSHEAPTDEPIDPGSTVTLMMVGDIMLDTLPGETIASGGDPFARFAEPLLAADVTVGNLECVIATKGEKIKKPYNFRAHPRVLAPLKKYFEAVSLANNHTGDFGPEALAECIERLETAGLPFFGAGRNLAEAHRPFVFERNGIKVALLGYDEFRPKSFEAGPQTPGVAWSLGPEYETRVLADIREAKTERGVDLVIPFMHWGWEDVPANDRQKEFARRMIDAGADVIVGGHPHVVQGVDSYKGKLIVYSLGNFVFDGYTDHRVGWLLKLTLNKQGVVRWQTMVARADEQGTPHRDPMTNSPRGEAVEGKITTG
jgi:poly-gamma-glutamate capsule biosynthesis protein CapA/YwtB (metallophosphatase superfamily)